MAIKHNFRLKPYYTEVSFRLSDLGEGPELQRLREKLSTLLLSPDEQAELEWIDGAVIEILQDEDSVVAPYLLEDDESQPIEKWWWHLGKIANGTYPQKDDLLKKAA